MIGENFISIREPQNDDNWFILQTDKGYYELRLGGIAVSTDPRLGPAMDMPFANGRIKRILSDNFEVYIELDNGFGISHSDTWIDANGRTVFTVNVYHSATYITDRGFEDMKPIDVIV